MSVPPYTPIATPVVPAAPPRTSGKSPEEPRPRNPLVAPVAVITPQGELELGSGSLLIGRLPECDVLLQDNLVSRMHARISVQHDSVVVEDLHSSNGVYVNGQRVNHSAVLREGDRILIGTTELSLFECRASSLVRIRQARRVSLSLEAAAPSGAGATLPPRVSSLPDAVPSTTRADALKMIGGLADRLAASGNVDEAAQVLSGHLRRVLKGANAGLPVPAEVADSASHHALTLARWTKLALWVDYVIELHLAARLVVSSVTLSAFDEMIVRVTDFDRMLLSYYADSMRDLGGSLNADERRRVEHLTELVKR